jgi:hypothetical protein
MRILILPFFLLLSVPALADVRVSFLDASRYTDAGEAPGEAERNTAELGKHLEALGRRYLKPDQTLTIEVLDIDLAGRTHVHAGRPNDVRVMTGTADWPRIKLKYTLETKGEGPRSAEESVFDMGYLQNPDRTGQALAYEKRMLGDWFRKRFAQGSR